MSKFSYNAGLFGYGLKGIDGSAGDTGFSLYFSDYDLQSNSALIKNIISNNEVLWKTKPGIKLPGNREYQNDELIVDSFGSIYKINFSDTKYFTMLSMKLSKVTYFTTDSGGAPTATGNFYRYYNIFNASTRYIIDNVYSSEVVDYENIPSTIYGILPKNFARIEYCNIKDSSYNPFTVYSSGEIIYDDDHKAIAIVRDLTNNSFRIGNTSPTIRNTNLTLDFRSIKRNDNRSITLNSSPGEILSVKDFGINTFFDNIFITEPSSFLASSPDSTSLRIQWNLLDFTSDPSIYGELYVYEKLPYTQSFNTLMFHDIPVDSSITILDLVTDTTYTYYMKILRDGWSRTSVIKDVSITGESPRMYIEDPSDLTLDASASGLSFYSVEISTNQNWITKLRYAVGSPTGWLYREPSTGTASTDYITFDISVYRNTATSQRIGYIDVESNATTQIIKITQDASYVPAPPITVQFNNSGHLVFTGLTTQTVSVTIQLYAKATAESNTGGNVRESDSNITIYKNYAEYYTQTAYIYVPAEGGLDSNESTNTLTVTGITTTTFVNVDAIGDCGNNASYDWADSNSYALITNITITSGSGTASIGTLKYWYYSHVDAPGGDCTEQKYASA